MNEEKSSTTIGTNSENVVTLLNEGEIPPELQSAEASISLNPVVSWMKFGLTDDIPNENKMRIPLSEFANLIKTGLYMPIKMAKKGIKPGHEDSEPLGTITNLKVVENQIIGLAALWQTERPEDIQILRDRVKEKKPINISWELLYTEASIDENGIKELHDVTLKAATIVDRPAYKGRTQVVAFAAIGSPAFLDELPDTAFLYVKEDGDTKLKLFPFTDKDGIVNKELVTASIENIRLSSLDEALKETLLAKATELLMSDEQSLNMEVDNLEELETLKAELATVKADLEAAKVALAAKEAEVAARDGELSGLREFKSSIEAEKAEASKLEEVKTRFAEAGITKEPEYFTENKKFLLEMKEEALAFMIQEFVAFSSSKPAEHSASSSTDVPPMPSADTKLDIKSIAEALRTRGHK